MSDAAFRTLSLIARALCEDAGIQLAASTGGWAWDPRRRTILVDVSDLERTGIQASAGIIAHEVGHARMSRGTLAASAELPAPLAHGLLNALEDRRCEAWIADRYLGTAAWLDAARIAHRSDLDNAPLYVQFMIAAADPASLEPSGAPVAMDRRVRDALQQTRTARLAYRDTRPDAELMGWHDARGRMREGALPYPARFVGERGEAGVESAAVAAAEIANAEVRPVFAAFVGEDARTLAQATRQNPRLAARALAELDWGQMLRLAAGAPSPTRAEITRALAKLANQAAARGPTTGPASRILAAALGRRAPTPVGSPRPGRTRVDRVRGDAARLTTALEPVFPRRRPGWGRGLHDSGQRPSLPAVMRLEANPRASSRIWQRRTEPQRRSAAVLLLVDLSGSMRHGKIGPTLDAVTMLVTALGSLAIPLAVYGFQDELISVLPFGSATGAGALPLIDAMADEVHGRAAGGHNVPGYNDDGPCLDEAAGLLAQRPQADKILMVLSDGAPSGVRSGPAELHAAVARWSGKKSPVRLVGIGIGCNDVAEYYPDAVAGVAPDRLPAALAEVLVRRLGVGQ